MMAKCYDAAPFHLKAKVNPHFYIRLYFRQIVENVIIVAGSAFLAGRLSTQLSTGSVEQSPDHESKGREKPRSSDRGFGSPALLRSLPRSDQGRPVEQGISCGKGYVTLSVFRSLWQAVQKSAGRDLLRGEP
jgi:hypothetical protein